MKNFICLFLVLFSYTAKSQILLNKDGNDKRLTSSPNIKIDIKLTKDTVESVNDLVLTIKATNETDKTQEILFDKPTYSLIGPWCIHAKVIDTKTGKSMFNNYNKTEMLASQIFDESHVKGKYISLGTKKYLSITYRLTDIIYLERNFNSLPSGVYELEVSYYNNKSNKVKFYIN